MIETILIIIIVITIIIIITIIKIIIIITIMIVLRSTFGKIELFRFGDRLWVDFAPPSHPPRTPLALSGRSLAAPLGILVAPGMGLGIPKALLVAPWGV